MNDEKVRFKKQFTDAEWEKLNLDSQFRDAWEGGDMTKAGEIFPQIIIGNAKNKIEQKRIMRKNQKRASLEKLADECL